MQFLHSSSCARHADCNEHDSGFAGSGVDATCDYTSVYLVFAPASLLQQWMQQHFWRTVVYSPYFDTRTAWYSHGLVYEDIYAIYTNSALAAQHAEWILKDAYGNN